MKIWQALWPPILSFVAVALLAEVLVRLLGVPAYLLPAPSRVLATLLADGALLAGAAGATAQGALAGFALSALAGVLLAVGLSTSRLVERALYPYTVFFQTVPIIAIAPLLVLWFGQGMRSVAVCAFIVGVFPVIANTLAGLRSTDPALRDLFRLHGASPLDQLLKLKLPSALPNIVTGLRIASGLAVIGAIVGEFFAGFAEDNPGLGITILAAYRQLRTDLLFAAVLLASLLGLTLFGLIQALGHYLLRHWHPSQQ